MSALREAFLDELRDLLDAELQLLKGLPKMAKAAEHEGLSAAFQQHQDETAGQIRRLGQVFEVFEEMARGKRCKGMKGLLEEAEEIIEEEEGDAALIGAAQKAEHYEIAAYGTLISWAVALGQEEVVELLQQSLAEEKATDKKLTVIAQTVVNSHDSLKEGAEEKPKARKRQPKQMQSRAGAKSSGGKRATGQRQTTKRGGAGSRRSAGIRGSKAPRSKRLHGAGK
jgi:ferritin-like metal-binding protein YciE